MEGVEEIMKKLLNNDLFLRIFSVVAAFLCWVYIVFITNPEIEVKVTGIPVTLADHQVIKNTGHVVSNDINTTVDIKVKGTRQRLANFDRASVIAYVDLSDCTDEKTYQLPINIKLPYEDIKLVNKSIQKISIAVDKYVTREFPIEYSYKGELKSKDYSVHETKLLSNSVRVAGPESVIKNIDKASVTIDISGISDDISGFATVTLLNSNNDEVVAKSLDIQTKDVSYKCIVYQKKDLSVVPSLRNTPPEDYSCTVTDHPTITVEGPASDVDAITEISTEPFSANESATTENYNVKLIIPENVSVAEEIKSVNVLVEKNDNTD